MLKIIHVQFLIGIFLLFILSAVLVTAGEISPQLQTVLDTAPPNEEIAVIVQLNDQIDRKQFKKFKKKLRRLKLLKELKQQAAASQSSLKSFIINSGGKNVRSLWIINGLSIKASASTIKKLAKRSEVMEVRLDMPVSLVNDTVSPIAMIQWNLAMLDTDLAWEQGYLGQGVVVASMDSGVDNKHASLAGSWRGGTNSWFDPHGQHSSPYDASGHGTQTMGIMVGQNLGGLAIGMAPEAQWIAVKVFDDSGAALSSDIHAGFQWLLDPDGNPDTDDAPDIINNSWGFPETINSCYQEFQSDIETLRNLDISLVFAAGNQGGALSSISPANNAGVFSVGAVDQSGFITSFSNQGPSACGQGGIYPNAVAPGYLVNTTDLTFGGLFPNASILVNGTSFAAPHISGAMALLLSSNSDLTPDDLESAITQSSIDLGDMGEDNVYGYGLVNVANALAFLAEPSQCSDVDGDGYFAGSSCALPVDCDDTRPDIYPGAIEIAHDTIDQNCDGFDLTINITRAIYKRQQDILIIVATSSYGSSADLQVNIPRMRSIPLRWNARKERWQRGFRKISERRKRLRLNRNTIIMVSGPEGAVSVPLSIRR